MTSIGDAQRALAAARDRLDAAVAEERKRGTTWAQIGEELQMTRQAAFKRFGKPANPQDGASLPRNGAADVARLAEVAMWSIARGRFDEVRAAMDRPTARELTTDVLTAVWARALANVGELESCTGTHAELPDGTVLEPEDSVLGDVVGVTTLRCEAGELMGRVAVNDKNAITGILIVPPDRDDLPF